MHDYIMVFAKKAKENREDPLGWQREMIKRSDAQEERYQNIDNDPRGPWTSVDYTCNKTADERPNLYYPIQNPNTGKDVWPSKSRVWRFDKETHENNVVENKIYWGGAGRNFPRLKRFRTEVSSGVVPSTWWNREFAGDNQLSKREIRQIFTDYSEEFATPKPTLLIERILDVCSAKNQNDIVLDSFAGSGTTAHAVLALNKEDGGNRKFILVECEDYADSITAERVRRVIKGVPRAKDENLKKELGGTFSYFELGKPMELEEILSGRNLPSYKELARYVFYTATGECFDEKKIDQKKQFIGESANYQVFLLYEPDIQKLKGMALTLEKAEKLPPIKTGKRRLVFAPTKYLDQEYLEKYKIDFAQLPFEIYQRVG